MIELQIHNRKGHTVHMVPESWSELTREQLIMYATIVYPHRKKMFSIENEKDLVVNDGWQEVFDNVRMGMLYALVNIPFKQFAKLTDEFVHDMLYCMRIVDFIFMEYDLDSNLIASVEVDEKKYYGPVSFELLTWDEFAYADKHFIDFVKEAKEESLNQFFAALYRAQKINYNPADPSSDGDIREPFNLHTIEYRLPDIAKISQAEKIAALIWYECERDVMIANNEVVFTGAGAAGKLSPAETVLHIAGGLANFSLVRNSPALLVVSDLKRMITEHNNMKRKHGKNN